ncbi:MAG: YaeQ family protein, partial [Sutterella sp.]
DFGKVAKLSVISVSDEQVTALGEMASRNMKLAVTIQDGVIWVSNDRDSLQIDIRVLQSEREEY